MKISLNWACVRSFCECARNIKIFDMKMHMWLFLWYCRNFSSAKIRVWWWISTIKHKFLARKRRFFSGYKESFIETEASTYKFNGESPVIIKFRFPSSCFSLVEKFQWQAPSDTDLVTVFATSFVFIFVCIIDICLQEFHGIRHWKRFWSHAQNETSRHKNLFVPTDFDEKYLETQNQFYWKNVECDRARSNCDQNENSFGEGTLHRLKTSSEMESVT